jgi:Zn-dependent peptidase ImmA (M78 family)/transcriptional regulator with XRE-family HTH domain
MFQGDRLTLARWRRGMNKTQLAKAVGLTAGTVAAYEKGASVPAGNIVARLAEALCFPVSFFFADPIDPIAENAASFRALSRMPASQRDVARATGTLCVEINAWFESMFDLPEPDLPEIDPMVATPQAAAGMVRAAWSLGESPLPSVLHLMESRGARVFALVPECRDADAYSFWQSRPFICVRTDRTAERMNFDLAHELGHLVMHRGGAGPIGRDAERQADHFASSFLMPEQDVRSAALVNPDLGRLVEAKKRWKVSAAALNFRLHQLGITSDWHYHRLCVQLSRIGRHLEIDPLPREHSQVLTKILTALRTEHLNLADIAAAVRIMPQDVDDLLAGLAVRPVSGEDDGTGDGHPSPNLRLV